MSDRARPFKQGDVTRALKAIAKAGQLASAVRITPTGEVTIELNRQGATESENEWDQVIKE